MINFTDTTLWKAAFGQANDGLGADKLSRAYLDLRELAGQLVSEISADLRQYTVHDITHLDALWGIASEIVGPEFSITPTEGYVLGATFLLHDAGMSLAAYPGGLSEIAETEAWQQLLQQTAAEPDAPTEQELQACVVEFIRLEHANRARALPNVQWKAPDGTSRALIEDGGLRQKFGSFIGEVAASHWWSIDKLADELNRVIPAPPPFPSDWSLDLLKVASILRVADAAHIDERRAPHFLWALRGTTLNDISANHWLFQSRITQPKRKSDAIYYSSTVDFREPEANAWWTAHDALQIIDQEIRSVDVLLADLRDDTQRFAARRVANCETPATLTRSIRVSGWVPIDTSIRVGDTPSLIRKLGGEALYGQRPLVPLRELVQNCGDALRLRGSIQGGIKAPEPITIEICCESGNEHLKITDSGVGMDAEIIQKQLLSFGDSGWKRDPIFRDYPNLIKGNPQTSGKYGIGFFSIFMLGRRVEIITRRFDRAFKDTVLLKFPQGLSGRPILTPAPQDQWLMEGGTTVRVWLDDPDAFFRELGISEHKKKNPIDVLSPMLPAFEFPIKIIYNGKFEILDGTKWQSEDANALVARVLGHGVNKSLAKFAKNLRHIRTKNGKVAGRMALVPRRSVRTLNQPTHGSVIVNGAASTAMSGFIGIIEGEVLRAARDIALPILSQDEWLPWLSEQAHLIKSDDIGPEAELQVAEIIAAMGGDPEPLAICESSEGWLSTSSLRQYLQKRDRISIASSLSLTRNNNKLQYLRSDILFIPSGTPGIFQTGFRPGAYHGEMWRYPSPAPRNIESLILKVVASEWNLDHEFLLKYASETVDGMYAKYDVPVEIGNIDGVTVKDFAHIYNRNLTVDDLNSISIAAESARIACGDYNKYFGEPE